MTFCRPIAGLLVLTVAALPAAGLSAAEIHTASQQGNVKRLAALLKGNPNLVNQRDNNKNTPLRFAVDNNHLAAAKLLLAQGADATLADNYGRNPLHQACIYARKDFVELLAAKSAALDAKDRNGYTPLHYSTQNARQDIVQLLLDKGADPTKKNNYQMSSFLLACNSGNQAMIELFLKTKKVDVEETDRGGRSPLHLVAQYQAPQRPKLIERLIKAGAKVDAADTNGQTPLMYAARTSDVADVLQLLIAKGADVNVRTKTNQNCLHAASQTRVMNPDVLKYLLEQKLDANLRDSDKKTPLHYAVQHSQVYGYQTEQQKFGVQRVELLLDAGAKVNLQDTSGYTPLHLAVMARNHQVADRLLAFGADGSLKDNQKKTAADWAKQYSLADMALLAGVNTGDVDGTVADGSTLLHVAARAGYPGAAKVLLKRGADANRADKKSRTPLQIAVENENPDLVDVLLPASRKVDFKTSSGETMLHWSAGQGLGDALAALIRRKVDLNVRNDDGDTALHAAVWNARDKIVRQLLAAGTEVDALDGAGQTPLYGACWNGETEIAKLLLDGGASAGGKANKYSPLHAAAWQGHAEATRLLIARGAAVNARDSDGSTPLHKAAWRGHFGVVELLLAAKANPSIKDGSGFTAVDVARSAKGLKDTPDRSPERQRVLALLSEAS